MLDCKNSIKTIGDGRIAYVFICLYPGCRSTIKVRKDALKTATGMCKTHAHAKRPFESIYNRLFNDWRRPEVKLSYEQFLWFTKIKNCHYCGVKINRQPFATVRGKFGSAAYFLDRKNHKKPYSRRNCVVCCTQCNILKGSRFTYNEFLRVGLVLAEIRLRKGK